MFRLLVSHHFARDAKKAPEEMKSKLPQLIDYIERNPVPVERYDVKKMKGEKGIYRIRIGEYRIIYSVDFLKKEIVLLKMGKRDSVYE